MAQPSVIISPSGSGTVNLTVIPETYYEPDGYGYYYLPNAIPSAGFSFVHFVVHWRTSHVVPVSGEIVWTENEETLIENPATLDHDGWAYLEYHYPTGTRYRDREIISITAVFEEVPHTNLILRDASSGIILRNEAGTILRDS